MTVSACVRALFLVVTVLLAGVPLCPASALAARADAEPARPGAKPEAAARADRILGSIVGVRAYVPGHARTAPSLGTERQGTGVVIDDKGLVLTIGYLILEAEKAELVLQDGDVRPATLVAYDHGTGFGLLRAAGPNDVTAAELCSSAELAEGAGVVTVDMCGPLPITPAQVVSRRDFAGYWEYLLENAIFTAPANPFFGGAALFDLSGRLVGVGSLVVNDAAGPEQEMTGNMFIPIDVLKPALAAMVATGRGPGPRNPWLGLYPHEARGRLFVMRVAEDGPAAKAGIKPGDIILGAGGKHVSGMADFFRRVWSQGGPGSDIVIDVLPKGAADLEIRKVTIRALDRYDWLRMTH
ncbi:MAG: S1C family serine protease [Rhodospirillales bacterium]